MPSRLSTRVALLALLALAACSSEDENAGIDRGKVEAAPQKFKDACEKVCKTTEVVRSKGCGQVQYSNYESCYLHCVDQYLRLPQCEEIFDTVNDCLNQYVCEAETECLGQVMVAVACRDGKLNPQS